MRGLVERLRRKTEEDRRLIEEHGKRCEQLFESELKRLSENLRRRVAAELNTTAGAMGKEHARQRGELVREQRRTSALLLKAWRRPVAVIAAVMLGVFGASWMLTSRLAGEIERLVERRELVESDIEAQGRTWERMEERVWGIRLEEREGKRMLWLPRGSVDGRGRPMETGWIELPQR